MKPPDNEPPPPGPPGSLPPWARHRRHRPHPAMWRQHRRRLFWRMVVSFSFLGILLAAGMAALALLVNRLVQGDGRVAQLVWVLSCSLSFALPVLALVVARSAFRRFATPMADIMAAADAIADGDLSARVPQTNSGDFGRLARSFNNMAGELEKIDRERRNLTADVAHELRTPLHIIQGNLEGVLDGVYQPTPDHIEETLEETRLLSRLVEDLRTLSLAESGQLPLLWEKVDVAELLSDVATSFSGQAERADIELSYLLPAGAELPRIRADAGRLDQVLGNLVVNALRHTPPGGQIKLAAQATAAGVAIQVSDSGSGIPPEDLPYIFDRFWRGDRARAHAGGASGLGLAIARQLVHAHGGTLSVESHVGQGSTFTIELPADLPSS